MKTTLATTFVALPAALLVGLAGCFTEPEPRSERIDEVQKWIESMTIGVAGHGELPNGEPFTFLDSRPMDPDLDREGIRDMARERGLTEAETDILLERMRDAGESRERDAGQSREGEKEAKP